ncbi:hypothetical protein H0H81_009706 [Sphagnurus paluster]|uniref:Uncharacterized protein n=1 Tax=Sphagnurus paluster TaxID=117069 RepID=A0A9P7GQ15_9AGAR|nr:hypothetical protein H0H81_009706 [Sphagnurus paluster]
MGSEEDRDLWQTARILVVTFYRQTRRVLTTIDAFVKNMAAQTSFPRWKVQKHVRDAARCRPHLHTNYIGSMSIGDEDLEDDLDNLELLYPEPAKDASSNTEPQKINSIKPAPSKPKPPRSRKKKSDSVAPKEIFTSVPRENPAPKRKRSPPRNPECKPTPKPFPRICTSPGCGNALQVESMTARCFRCVMADWKARTCGVKEKSASKVKRRRKKVTWADLEEEHEEDGDKEIDEEEERNLDSQDNENGIDREDHPIEPEERSEEMPLLKIKIRIPRRTSVSQSEKVVGSSPPPLSQATSPIILAEASTPKPSRTEASEVAPHPPAVDPPLEPLDTDIDTVGAPKAAPDTADSSPTVFFKSHLNGAVPGWDSDLTDISDLSDDAESEVGDVESSSDSEPPISRHSGLTIRIPARPPKYASSTSVCNTRKCGRPLPEGYRWKACVLCRLNHREYQRKRQHIKGRHTRLDLEAAQFCETELAPPHINAQKTGRCAFLVPGARLCSIKNCTHVIPPRGEYRWKMCDPCRIRTRENRHGIRSVSPVTEGVETGDDVDEPGEPAPGAESEDVPLVGIANERCDLGRRCTSLDCGMLLNPDTKGMFCIQCSARRADKTRLPLKQVGTSKPLRDPSKEATPAPYAEYKCWTALISEFHAGFKRRSWAGSTQGDLDLPIQRRILRRGTGPKHNRKEGRGTSPCPAITGRAFPCWEIAIRVGALSPAFLWLTDYTAILISLSVALGIS